MGKVKYTTEQIDENTILLQQHLLTTQVISYLLLGKEKALLVDTGQTLDGLAELAKSLTEVPIEVVCTHGHLDHIGANHKFGRVYMHPADKEVFALHTDPAYLKTMLESQLPAPVRLLVKKELAQMLAPKRGPEPVAIEDGYVFDLGSRLVEVVHTPGHTMGSVCLLDRAARQLFTGDTVCDEGVLLHLDCCGTPADFLQSIQRLQGLAGAFDELWPGHHKHPLDKGYLEEYEACAKGILDGSLPAKRVKQGGKAFGMTAKGRIRLSHRLEQ